MTKDFEGVKMQDVVPHGAATRSTLLVRQAWCDADMIFVKLAGGDAFLNAEQVRELVRRMTAWLEGRMPPSPVKLWEDA